ncbi:hypothetical protein SAMN02745181_0463 [Rubritalea squalenifaciens DSM 18772]|uniref:Uncharacterized protein n=1 Tax=Rubritalea squalenifaciens DSM 18772 TaxID=1123071 RepID=A0A1M6CFI5_9BACT|nr:hypothetical protein SAMN02745181_0463 [Rubritalea squalenifaciens DSM 18772]
MMKLVSTTKYTAPTGHDGLQMTDCWLDEAMFLHPSGVVCGWGGYPGLALTAFADPGLCSLIPPGCLLENLNGVPVLSPAVANRRIATPGIKPK